MTLESVITPRAPGPDAGDSWSQRHPVLAYFVVAYTISWVYWLVALGALGHDGIWWIAPGVFGPPVAAVVITARADGTSGLRELGRRLVLWRVGAVWYLVGLIALPTLVVLSYLFLPGGADRIREEGWLFVPTLLAYAFVIAVIGGGQEEVGWRGFALPRLQERWGALRGATLVGLLWGLWHLPLFAMVSDYNDSGIDTTSVVAMYLLFVGSYAVGMSIVLAWLFNNTHGSVMFVMLVHGFTNAAWVLGPMTQARSAAFYLLSGVLGLAIAIGTRGHLGLGGPPRRPRLPRPE